MKPTQPSMMRVTRKIYRVKRSVEGEMGCRF
jgi:hypothetical protein